MKRRSQHTIARLLITAVAMVCAPDDTYAQLRVVSYNTLDKPISSLDGTLFDTVFSAIAATSRNGFAKRVDVLALQEQSRQLVSGEIVDTSQLAADRLNSLFGVSSYQASLVGAGLDRVAIVYDTASVQLISAQGVDFSGTRPAQLATFLPVGYSGQAAELHLFSTHFNAGSSSTRASEALGLQQKVLELAGAGSHTIVAGDFNFGSSSEQGYQTLAASASSVTSDPLSLGAWPNSGVAQHMTQSTRTGSLADGGASGGMDDRFDLQLVTSPLLDGEGLSYLGPTAVGLESLEHSYQAFGNDGVSWNTRINNTLSGRSQSAEVLNALHNFSDHLPVVADYQVPAVLEAVAGSLPEELLVDEEFSLEVMIRNAADVVAAIGADELDYQLSVTGDLVGQAIGSLAALTAGDSVPVMLDTATPGVRSGVIIISTDSQGAANALVELPISFEVVASSLQGDFDLNGVVDAADYTVWRDGLGAEYDQQDYFDWRSNYGQTSSAIGAVGAPEPAAALVLWAAVASTAPFRRLERRGCSLA